MIFDTLMGMFQNIPQEISLGRMIESAVLLSIIWSKLKPHLKVIETRLEGLENAVKEGFALGETRFQKIERRLNDLETQRSLAHGQTLRPEGFSEPLKS